MLQPFTLPFSKIRSTDVESFGGKNASLGELYNSLRSQGVQVPPGFATHTDAFRLFLKENNLELPLSQLLAKLNTTTYSNLAETGQAARQLVSNAPLPHRVASDIRQAYRELCIQEGREVEVAVRSSASAEDLPTASFAGQHESFLNIKGENRVVDAVHRCFVSLYTDRAIKYRIDNGFAHPKVALSAGVQKMVRSDLSASGVAFTLEPETGFRNVIVINGVWGLGENIVQGTVTPDEFQVFKTTLKQRKDAILMKRLGSKEKTMVYGKDGEGLLNMETEEVKRNSLVLNDSEITLLASWCLRIEEHYGMPMDIEWAKDGVDGQLYIVQARPETVHARQDISVFKEYQLTSTGTELTRGIAVGSGIASGKARLLKSPAEAHLLQEGEILVTETTNPDWDPILKKAAAIVTNRGGRTSHAAIVARELGALAVVGCHHATDMIHDGMEITVSCAEGKTGRIYAGKLAWQEHAIDLHQLTMPVTDPMLILGDPDKAYRYAAFPNRGVGLLRLEFIINHSIGIHPMALVHFDRVSQRAARQAIESLTRGYSDKPAYFIDKLSQAVATIAAAFYPKPVIVRMSDFKSNEYANLVGGTDFEPVEENPMIGFRGASRYYHERYREGFRLECMAMKRVREDMGLNNVKLMIPFCRTVEEGKKVIDLMAEYGLKRGVDGLEIYVMAEVPSNVLLAEEFARIFDGFSIGSNDLTQLTLGVDRDSAFLAEQFNENNPAVLKMIAGVIRTAHAKGVKIGLCGQGPSDDPAFARFLILQGINSISFNPDALVKGISNMVLAEEEFRKDHEAHVSTMAFNDLAL
jgi:pyruvate,water dikinase